MLRLDKNDPLDRMILQELRGEPVLFDTWLDAMDELDEEPDCSQILQARGLHFEDVLREAKTYRQNFQSCIYPGRPFRFKIDRFDLCAGLLIQAESAPSPALLEIYCDLLSGSVFLLAQNRTCTRDEEESTILQYLEFCQERTELLNILRQRIDLAQKFNVIKKQIRNLQPIDCDIKNIYEIAFCFAELFRLPAHKNENILLDNLANYIQIAASSPELKSAEPLFLFRLLTKHKSRMCTVPDLHINLPALWQRDKMDLSRNNGRNFKQGHLYLQFFRRLCQIYQKDPAVDLALCWYGLDQLTSLGTFYREYLSPGWCYVDMEEDFPFVPTIEALVEDAQFSCFENGYGDLLLFKNSDITCQELIDFLTSDQPPIIAALETISDYMNLHISELAIRFATADDIQINRLCQEILEQSAIRYQPKSPRETAFFLIAINNNLMACLDWVTEQILIQAGHLLLHEPTQISLSLE